MKFGHYIGRLKEGKRAIVGGTFSGREAHNHRVTIADYVNDNGEEIMCGIICRKSNVQRGWICTFAGRIQKQRILHLASFCQIISWFSLSQLPGKVAIPNPPIYPLGIPK